MAQIVISALPTGTPKGTDLTPATDTTDTTSAPTGTTKKYVRADEANYYLSAQGYVTLTAVRLASTTALTVTYANGVLGVGATLTNAGAMAALSLDSVPVVVGNRVLIQNQASAFQNGIYIVSVIGSGATNWVLTRATDYDQAAEIAQGQIVLVNFGTTYAGKYRQQVNSGPFTIGTTSIVFDSMAVTNPTFTWNTVTGTTQAMAVNNGYNTNNAGATTLTLPATSAVGDLLTVCGQNATGSWIIAQNAGQSIHVSPLTTTVGVGGSLASTAAFDSINLVCQVANTVWTVRGGPQGVITIV